MANYDGPVIFGSDGVHYPAVEVEDDPNDTDETGARATHPDFSRPLRWVEGTTYRDAEPGEPLHNDVHHQREVVLEVHVGGPAAPEGDDEILLNTEAEAQAVRDLLQTMRGGQ